MSNRIFLYMTSEPGRADASPVELAEAVYDLPPLWQILLAGGRAVEAITDQRVFGDAGTANVGAEASAGLARLRQLRDFMAGHPFSEEFGGAGMHFDTWLDALEREAAQLTGQGRTAWLSANVDELSWLSDEPPETCIDECLARCNDAGAALEPALRQHSYALLDQLLWPPDGPQRWDWAAWFEAAGLHGRPPFIEPNPTDVSEQVDAAARGLEGREAHQADGGQPPAGGRHRRAKAHRQRERALERARALLHEPDADRAQILSLLAFAAGLPDGEVPASGLPRPEQAEPDGLPDAMWMLAEHCLAPGDAQAQALARAWLEQAVTHAPEHPQAHAMLGWMWTEGVSGPADMQRGLLHYEQAARGGELMALHNLGMLYAGDRLGRPDPARALDYYRQADALGDGDAPFEIGQIFYLQGFSHALDDAQGRTSLFGKARYYLEKAVLALDSDADPPYWAPYAWRNLGVIAWWGEDGHADPDRAIAWLERAGHAEPSSKNVQARQEAMELLLNEVYGASDSPRRDAGKQAYWQRQLGGENQPVKAKGLLGRLFGRH